MVARVALSLLCLTLVSNGACKETPRSPPPPPRVASDASTVADAGSAAPYRTAASTHDTHPELAGSSKRFMVVSEDTVASTTGRDILAAGGNAVDAAVATAFALAVVHPTAGNLGGGGFAVVRTGPGKVAAIDFREMAPKAATANMYLDATGNPTDASLVGHRAAGVPGSVAGLWALHEKFGKKPWKELVAPAIVLARDGFALAPSQATSIAKNAQQLARFPASAAIWLPDGKPRTTGDIVKIPELAKVLERIAARGAAGFYRGETAELIVAEMKRGGGLITAADLAAYKVAWREPVRARYRGYALSSMPPPSSGGVVLALTANILGRVDVGKLGWHSAEHVHWLVETWRRGYAARNEMLGDPAFVKNPVDRLTSRALADKLASSIGPRATPSTAVPQLLEGHDTTNLVTVDGADMAVALTTTINVAWGSYVTVTGGGFLLNNEMDDFTAKPGAPNVFGLVQGEANKIEPGKRMLSSMSPTIVEDETGKLQIVIGVGRGGPRIITALWQILSNVVDFGMAPDAAVAAPRIHFQHLPDVVKLEADSIDQPTEAALAKLGHAMTWQETKDYYAAGNLIVRTATGWSGAADPRNGGAALGD